MAQSLPHTNAKTGILATKKQEALKFMEQGNFSAVLACLAEIKTPDAEMQQLMQQAKLKLARKYWRQRKIAEFESALKHLDSPQQMQLALARLQGEQKLREFATANHSNWSILAACSLEKEQKGAIAQKKALLILRQISEFKGIAEGWLALSKGDFAHALELFRLASPEQPRMAQIGAGIVHLAQGNIALANSCLASLRLYAVQHYPQLFEAMGWKEAWQEIESNFFLKFHQITLEEAEKIEKALPPQAHAFRGWLYLKMGDLIYASSHVKSLTYWSKAAELNPALKLDCLKRKYIQSWTPKSASHPESAFLDFYLALVEHSPAEAQQFVEYLVFHSDKPYQEAFSMEALRDKKERWQLVAKRSEIKLLTLMITYACTLKNLARLFWLPSRPESIGALTWAEWENLFAQFDPHYSQHEKYLRAKVIVAKLFDQPAALAKWTRHLLEHNPALQGEFLPLYVSSLQGNKHWKSREALYQDIEALLTLFPSQFDLLRLSLLYSDSSKKETLLESYATKISAPLYRVLVLQYHLDKGSKNPVCKKHIPDLSQYGQSKEADWRLLYALLTPSLHTKKKELETLIAQCAPTHDLKHEFFSQIQQHGGGVIPISILNKWENRCEKSWWRPLYHQAFYYEKQGDLSMALDTLAMAIQDMQPHDPQYSGVLNTLEFYSSSAEAPEIEDLEEEELQMLTKAIEQLFAKKKKMNEINPFQILDIPYDASEADIHKAWQAKMKAGGDVSLYIKAYALIRDQRGRQQMKWDALFTCLAPLPLSQSSKELSLDKLIQELAFLSPWELGEEAIFINSSQGSAERGKARLKRSGLNEEGMAKAMPDEEDRSGKAVAGRTPDEFMKVAGEETCQN